MDFQHSPEVWARHPELVAGVVAASGITPEAPVETAVAEFHAAALERLAGRTESELPEIQAWRRAFAAMGLKPTQYRCASESLLRRLRKEGTLPSLHPLVDLCNAISVAFAIPVAALDVSRISGDLTVRPATGDEIYETFGGENEHPAPGEITFADSAGRSHARRWTNRQSGHSAVRPATADVLIVVEALHESAASDVPKATAAIADNLAACWPGSRHTTGLLTAASPRFRWEVPAS